MNQIEQQNQEATQSYITAEEFEEFKKNILGTLFDLTGDITEITNKISKINAEIHNIKTKDER